MYVRMLIREVAEALAFYRIPYAVVGGYAAHVWGAPLLPSQIEIAIPESRSDYLRAEKALESIGLQSQLPMNGGLIFDHRDAYIQNRSVHFWSFCNPRNPFESVGIDLRLDGGTVCTEMVPIGSFSVSIASWDELVGFGTVRGPRPNVHFSPDEMIRRTEDLRLFREANRYRDVMTRMTIRLPKSLLAAYRAEGRRRRVPYQWLMKKAMAEWLHDPS